jgi:hypothetical protein
MSHSSSIKPSCGALLGLGQGKGERVTRKREEKKKIKRALGLVVGQPSLGA